MTIHFHLGKYTTDECIRGTFFFCFFCQLIQLNDNHTTISI